MSFLPRKVFYDKHCVVYCGDDYCNCKLSPYYQNDYLSRDPIQQVLDFLVKQKDKQVDTDEQAYDDAMGILKEERGNE